MSEAEKRQLAQRVATKPGDAAGVADMNDRIGRDALPDGKWVSTVELKPGWRVSGYRYETKVFPAPDDYSELDCERYQTCEEAEAGHVRMVAKWQALAERFGD